MSNTCPRCASPVVGSAPLCIDCGSIAGTRKATNSAAAVAYVGSPGIASYPIHKPPRRIAGQRSASRTPTRRRWFRRKLVVIPLVLLFVVLSSIAGGSWYLNAQFDTLHQLSTPPPKIAGDQLGGNEAVTIDTSIARQMVEQSNEAREIGFIEPELSIRTTNRLMTSDNVGALPGNANQSVPDILDEPSQGHTVAGVVEPSQDSTAILLMGVDARPGEPIDAGVRPDSLAVVFLDGNDGSCRMLSIPRDTRTELPGYGQSKINHALSVGGVPYQMLVVEHLLGIELDHYGLIDFTGVQDLVDAVGGVTVSNGAAFSAGGIDFPAGTVALNGEEALVYARYRGGADGDFGRQERQQQLVRALLNQSAGMDLMASVPSLLSTVQGHVRTDLGPADMIGLAQEFRSTCTSETLDARRLDGSVATRHDDLLKLQLSFVLVEHAEIQQKVAWLTGTQQPDTSRHGDQFAVVGQGRIPISSIPTWTFEKHKEAIG